MTADPYLDFYREHDISPVRQNISDIARHFRRRDHLYRQLGLPPFAFEGRTVLEIGPGSGHNALYVASRRPAHYLLLEGNPRGVDDTRKALKTNLYGREGIKVIEGRVQDFGFSAQFDIVLCEGMIPHQIDPAGIARLIAQWVKPGGVLVITCADHVSVFSEVLRRLIRDTLMPASAPLEEQVERLLPIFGPHLATLPGMSRLPRDWIIDNIVQPWGAGPLFSIEDAITTLGPEGFTVFGGSPRFWTEWRWYKEISDVSAAVIEAYNHTGLSFLDQRYAYGSSAPSIVSACRRIWDLMVQVEHTGHGMTSDTRVVIASECDYIAARLLMNSDHLTYAAMVGVAKYFRQLDLPSLDVFRSFWGRGQQYLSFVRE